MLLLGYQDKIPSGERQLIYGIIAISPFVLFRLIFSLVSVCDNSPEFNMFSDSPSYARNWIGMCVVPEMITVTILEFIGLRVDSERKRRQLPTDISEQA